MGPLLEELLRAGSVKKLPAATHLTIIGLVGSINDMFGTDMTIGMTPPAPHH
jgi:hypothetical protein